jgi:hypothetical protein
MNSVPYLRRCAVVVYKDEGSVIGEAPSAAGVNALRWQAAKDVGADRRGFMGCVN